MTRLSCVISRASDGQSEEGAEGRRRGAGGRSLEQRDRQASQTACTAAATTRATSRVRSVEVRPKSSSRDTAPAT